MLYMCIFLQDENLYTMKCKFIVLAYCLYLCIHELWLYVDEYTISNYDSDMNGMTWNCTVMTTKGT